MKRLVHSAIVLAQVIFIILLATSCQKGITGDIASSDSTSTTTGGSKVRAYAEYEGTASSQPVLMDSFNLTYDSKDRVTSVISVVNAGKFIYSYNANNTYTMDIYVGNTLSIHALFFLNSFSLVDSSIQSNGTPDTTTEKYIYNSSKQLVTKKVYFYNSSINDLTTYNFSYDNNGNVVNETSDNGSSYAYEYYLDKPNDVQVGEVYFYRNRNLTKTTTTTSGGTTTTMQHTYTFDTQNRQTSEKMVTDKGDVGIRKYYY